MSRQHFYVTEGIDANVVRAHADYIRRLGRKQEPHPVTIHYHSVRLSCPGFIHDDFEVTE